MNIFLGYTILVLGVISALQTSFSFIAGDIYDIKHLNAIRHFKRKYYKPLVSVVIPAYNEEKSIYRSLTSIYASDYQKFEVIVVNDGSKDNTLAEIERFIQDHDVKNLTVITQENQGKAAALNNGISNYAKGILIMTLDADATVNPSALSHGVAHFKDRNVIATAASVRIMNDDSLLEVFQNIEYLFSYRLKKARTLLNAEYIIGGVGSMFRKRILKECKFYDTSSMTEDIALTLKIINKKGNKKNKIIYAADVVCYTDGLSSLKALFTQRYRWKYGFLQALFHNKELLFNRSSKYTKLLTLYNLPYAIYTEALSLLDPIIIVFILYYSVRYTNISLFGGMVLFLFGYTLFAIISDEYSTIQEKLRLILFTPLSYIYFLVLGIMGDAALIKSLFNVHGIIHIKESDVHPWETIRTGTITG